MEIYDLPVSGADVQEKKDGQGDRPSSSTLVAGARYVVEKKIPGRRVKLAFNTAAILTTSITAVIVEVA